VSKPQFAVLLIILLSFLNHDANAYAMSFSYELIDLIRAARGSMDEDDTCGSRKVLDHLASESLSLFKDVYQHYGLSEDTVNTFWKKLLDLGEARRKLEESSYLRDYCTKLDKESLSKMHIIGRVSISLHLRYKHAVDSLLSHRNMKWNKSFTFYVVGR
jgi:hypothetical protein